MDADSAAEEGATGEADSVGLSDKLLLASSAFFGLVALADSLTGALTSGASTAADLASAGASSALAAAALTGAGT